jgi:energy-converting hydrogenase Eha subunit G
VELTVGSLANRPVIVGNKATNNALSLTGRLDYAIVTLLHKSTDLANSLGLTGAVVEQGKQSVNEMLLVRVSSSTRNTSHTICNELG